MTDCLQTEILKFKIKICDLCFLYVFFSYVPLLSYIKWCVFQTCCGAGINMLAKSVGLLALTTTNPLRWNQEDTASCCYALTHLVHCFCARNKRSGSSRIGCSLAHDVALLYGVQAASRIFVLIDAMRSFYYSAELVLLLYVYRASYSYT